MKCPLFMATATHLSGHIDLLHIECPKEECAWWDNVGNSCVALSIYQELRLLVGACAPIADLVPPARRQQE